MYSCLVVTITKGYQSHNLAQRPTQLTQEKVLQRRSADVQTWTGITIIINRCGQELLFHIIWHHPHFCL
jgi:signal transduction histidine kinase